MNELELQRAQTEFALDAHIEAWAKLDRLREVADLSGRSGLTSQLDKIVDATMVVASTGRYLRDKYRQLDALRSGPS